MPLRVCIFARESLLHWASYYVSAFRAVCDVVSIGPPTSAEHHDFPDWSQVARYVVPNDIHSDEEDAEALLRLLPEGWHPDLIVAIQSGPPVISGISQLDCPTAYISVDTWHDPREFLLGYQYDFVFLAQKAMVKYMRKMGTCRAFWLPLACDPAAHYAKDAETCWDVSFIGSTHFMVNRQRLARLKRLEEHFSLGYAFGLGCDEMAKAYGKSRIIFNASIAQDVNMRVFEALATGKPLVTNREAAANGLFDLFEEGKHLVTYTDEDLVGQVRRCLDEPDWARAIGEAGRREVLEKHTYVHRVQALLQTLAEYVPDLGKRLYRPAKTGQRVAEFVPLGTRRLLDYGMGLDTTRVALRRQGLQYLAAVAPDGETLDRRARSYDTASLHSPDWDTGDAGYDAILWNRPSRLGVSWDWVFGRSRAWLVEGGRILVVMGGGEIEALAGEPTFAAIARWLLGWKFKLLVWRQGASEADYHLLVASYRVCTPEEVVSMLYHEFPVNGVDTDPGVRLITEEEPGSPGAECP